jgi:hypothetical protein
LRPPLFILSPPRSFTSISCATIGCHPQMFGLAEVNVFAGDTVAELLELYQTRRRLQYGLLRSLSELAFAKQTESSIEAARLWMVDNAGLSTAELFRTMQEWAGDRGLIDKSPLHVFTPAAMVRMGENFPDARYLHLTRHPGDMIKSIHQLKMEMREKAREKFPALARMGGDNTDPDPPDKMWLEPHLEILRFLESIPPERKMRMRGEDLLSDPRNYLTQIAEWLELSTGEDAIEAMLHPEASPFGCYGPANAKFGNDPNFMEQPALRPYKYNERPLELVMPNGRGIELSETLRAYAMMFGY